MEKLSNDTFNRANGFRLKYFFLVFLLLNFFALVAQPFLIPQPQKIELTSGYFPFSASTTFDLSNNEENQTLELLNSKIKLLFGFEINGSKPKFSENFIDQINFFNEVKTLISVSGSGLTNALFMQKNTNLIELITPFNIFYCSKFINEKSKNLKICNECISIDFCKEELLIKKLDTSFHEMCSGLDINYISMSNDERKSLIIQEKFLKNPYLLNILNN